MAKDVLVTGACGFVGRHVVLRLIQEGRRVWMVDDLSVGKRPELWLPQSYVEQLGRPNAPVVFVHGDVRQFFREHLSGDRSRFLREAEVPRFSDVFHFAAVVGGRAKIDGDPIAVATDLSIDAELFAWAVKARPDRVLFASSSAAYPIDQQTKRDAVALQEDMICFGGRLGQPDMTYGWSKLTGEYLAQIAARQYGLSVASVRPFSGYGEDQDETYPVPAIAARAARREDPFVVWGSGRQGRDFIHIEDCVEGMLLALDRISDGSSVNLGSGVLTTFLEVIGIFARFADYQPLIQQLEEKPVGVHSRYADMTHARNLLGWSPRISLEDGFRRVYAVACTRLVAGATTGMPR